MFRFLSPSKYSPLHAIHLTRHFSCTKQFSNVSVLMPFSASAIFSFHLFRIISKAFPIWGLFSLWKQKSLGVRLGKQAGRGTGVTLLFIKNCWALRVVWAGANHPSWNGLVCSVFKKIHWSWTQPLTTTPAGARTQMGSWNTHLAGEACTTRGPPSRI